MNTTHSHSQSEFQNALEKFQKLLEQLFQFESSDLDFGIYRILNYKRDKIKSFIQNQLREKVETEFAKHKSERLDNFEQKFEAMKLKIIESLGKNAITPSGDLKEEYKDTPIGKEFLLLKSQKEGIETIETIKAQVFNDLYNFFSRYYEDGDFVPQYRYSIKEHKYAIPYNGEEVKLYWANSEQYYIKTGILFRDYTFKANNYKIVFRTVAAKEELGSNKATKERFFVLDDENPISFTAETKTLIIRFQYRELTKEETEAYKVEGGSNSAKQEKINQNTFEEIINKLSDIDLKAALLKHYKDDSSLLFYHLKRFTSKNTKDYFIHKNLKKFLSEQLDYFIKSEVLDIETLEKEKFLDKHITRAKLVREIGENIIDFLSQIEDFQKKLWEKKKFVIKTEYVITLDKIKEYAGEEFLESILDEILNNEEQKKEWKELGFGEIETRQGILLKDNLIIREYKKLPIDTKHFDTDFKEKLLEKITENIDLDDALDGLLIKSENWQALNLLEDKYKEKIQTIYIDPPFNKEQDADFLYNVKYKDSTWITMLENRVALAKELLNEKGSMFVRCDYNGNMYVRLLMNEIFGEENFRNEIIIPRKRQAIGTPTKFEVENEYLHYYTKTDQYLRKDIFIDKETKNIKWTGFLKQGDRNPPQRIFIGKELYPPKGQHFSLVQEKVDKLVKEHYLRLKCRNCQAVYYFDEGNSLDKFIQKVVPGNYKYSDLSGKKVYGVNHVDKCINCGEDDWKVEYLPSEIRKLGNNWTDIQSYSDTQSFPTENSEILLKRVLESTSERGDLVMDFFLGSGTTVAVAHKLGRKWIGVEMGEHFHSVILPRMKRVLAYDSSGISKEKDVKEFYNEKNAGGFFKYQYLEQYEDALDNIELEENQTVESLFKDEYLLKYFLDFETRESPYLLNVEMLKEPFSYKLKVNFEEVGEPKEEFVDIPETFNYLLGLKIKKIKARKYENRKYLFVLGEKDLRNVVVIWRNYKDDWTKDDFEKDRDFIVSEIEAWEPDVVYVNGQSVLVPKHWEVRYIEPDFKRLMEV